MHMMIYGVIGILIMYSAKYLTGVVFSDVFKGGVGEAMTTVEWIQMLYDKIAFPFIKIAIYLSLGVLVILMMVRVFSYITAQDDSTKKKGDRRDYMDNGWNDLYHGCQANRGSGLWKARNRAESSSNKPGSDRNSNPQSKGNPDSLYGFELGFGSDFFCSADYDPYADL